MEGNINFQLKMDKTLECINEEIRSGKKPPTLFLHGCCAPCSSYVLEYLNRYFMITEFYYNPNIAEESEYYKRVGELKRLIDQMEFVNDVSLMEGRYDPDEYYKAVKGLEDLGERSRRCYECYALRLRETAKIASKNGFDYYTTTLSISPHKNAIWLNELGKEFEKEYKVKYLYADFKKRNGYKRSIELSKEYNLYRQDYCGCEYSKKERNKVLN